MRRILLAGLVACLVPKLALASIIQYNDQTSFAAATPYATQYVFSGGFDNFYGLYTQGPATFTSNSSARLNDYGYGAGVAYVSFYPARVKVTLAPSAYGIGLKLASFYSGDTLDVSVNGEAATTITSDGNPAILYVGLTDSDPITSVSLVSSPNRWTVELLNFAISDTPSIPVPEPASLLTLCVGALAATALRRRPTSRTLTPRAARARSHPRLSAAGTTRPNVHLCSPVASNAPAQPMTGRGLSPSKWASDPPLTSVPP